MKNVIKKNKKHKNNEYFNLPEENICKDLKHNPPTHLSIPQGKGYIYTCPSCGRTIRESRQICIEQQETTMNINLQWTKDKPTYACVFITRLKIKYGYEEKEHYEYDVYKFKWVESYEEEGKYYLGWFTADCDEDEYGDYDECNGEEYLVIEILPTLQEVKKQLEKGKENAAN